MRWPLRLIRRIRKAWSDKPLFVRISGTEWAGDERDEHDNWLSWGLEQSKIFTREIQKIGVDLIDVSSGGNYSKQKIPAAPGYQVCSIPRSVTAIWSNYVSPFIGSPRRWYQKGCSGDQGRHRRTDLRRKASQRLLGRRQGGCHLPWPRVFEGPPLRPESCSGAWSSNQLCSAISTRLDAFVEASIPELFVMFLWNTLADWYFVDHHIASSSDACQHMIMYRARKISRRGFLGKFRTDFPINLSHLLKFEQLDSAVNYSSQRWRPLILAAARGDPRRQLRPPIRCAMGSLTLTAGVTGPQDGEPKPATPVPWLFRGDKSLKHSQTPSHEAQDLTRQDGEVCVSTDRDRRFGFPDSE